MSEGTAQIGPSPSCCSTPTCRVLLLFLRGRCQDDDHAYIVSELCAGGDLKSLLEVRVGVGCVHADWREGGWGVLDKHGSSLLLTTQPTRTVIHSLAGRWHGWTLFALSAQIACGPA